MSRTKDFNETNALEAAMNLFWQKGFEATSIQALEKAMCLNRPSIYNAFGNKLNLFQKALDHYMNNLLLKFTERLQSPEKIQDALHGVLNAVVAWHFNKAHPGGCLIILSILENEQHDANTRKALDSALKSLRSAIIDRIEQGKQNHQVKLDVDSSAVANHIIALIAGMITMAKAGFSKKELENMIDNVSTLLYQSIVLH